MSSPYTVIFELQVLGLISPTCRRVRREGVGRGGAAVADKCCGNVRQGCYRRVEGGRRVVGRDVLEG